MAFINNLTNEFIKTHVKKRTIACRVKCRVRSCISVEQMIVIAAFEVDGPTMLLNNFSLTLDSKDDPLEFSAFQSVCWFMMASVCIFTNSFILF